MVSSSRFKKYYILFFHIIFFFWYKNVTYTAKTSILPMIFFSQKKNKLVIWD